MKKTLCFCTILCSTLAAEPPQVIPPDQYNNFTLNDRIPVVYRYANQSNPNTLFFSTEDVNYWLGEAYARRIQYYGWVDNWLFSALEKYLKYIQNKEIGVFGSTTCWYECVALRYGGRPTTIEYNPIIVEDPRLRAFTVDEFNKNPILFDAIISISSIEHDGLGRYGDPINPFGDIEFMKRAKNMVKKDGLMFLAVPVGKDELIFNWHRVYGRIRLPMLIEGWELLEVFGDNHEWRLDQQADMWGGYQPVLVLKNI